jgi:N6-L-threonylcarbamoyladenine synthase
LHKAKILKGGIRKANQSPKDVFGFRLWDAVEYDGVACYIKGRRYNGGKSIMDRHCEEVSNKVNYKKLRVLYHCRSNILIRMR